MAPWPAEKCAWCPSTWLCNDRFRWCEDYPRRGVVAIALAIVLAGCANVAAVNGPIAVELGDVRHMCLASGYDSPRGCVMKHPNGTYTIYCRDSSRAELAECLAHELRHIVEPEWRH